MLVTLSTLVPEERRKVFCLLEDGVKYSNVFFHSVGQELQQVGPTMTGRGLERIFLRSHGSTHEQQGRKGPHASGHATVLTAVCVVLSYSVVSDPLRLNGL